MLAYDSGAYSLSSWTSIAIAAWWVIFLGLGFGLVRLPALPPAAIAVGVLLPALAVLTLASSIWGPSDERALEEANRVTLYFGVFLLVAFASYWLAPARWIDGIALAVVAIAVVALASRFVPDLFGDRRLAELLPSSRNRLSFPVGYWNGLGIFTALGVPLLLRAAVGARSAVLRGAAVAPMPALAAVSYLASSRGGAAVAAAGGLAFLALTRRRWTTLGALAVAAAGSAAALAVLFVRDELANGPLTSPLVPGQGRSAALLLALICLACAVVYGSLSALVPRDVRLHPAVGWSVATVLAATALVGAAAANPVDRFEEFRRPPPALVKPGGFVETHFLSGNGSGRWQFWETAVDEFEHHPLGGGGAGSYESWWAEHAPISLFVRNAHSLYLESLAELGLGGAALVAAIFAVGVGAGIARRRAIPDDDQALAAATATLTAYAVAAGIDWMWELTAVSLVGFVVLGLVTGPATAGESHGRPQAATGGRSRLVLAVVTVAVALVAIAGQGISLLTAVELENSRAEVARDDLVGGLRSARAAHDIQPWAASPYLQLALVQEQAGAYRRARVSIREAIEHDGRDWRLWLIRARVETEAGAAAAAQTSLRRAEKLNPRSPLFSELR
jgi:hypothetical protein